MRYVIEIVQPRDVWMSKHGKQMQTYAVKLSGVDGWVQLNQVATTKPPMAGDALNGAIEKRVFNNKEVMTFKKEFSGGDNAPVMAQLSEIHAKLDKVLQILTVGYEQPKDAPMQVGSDLFPIVEERAIPNEPSTEFIPQDVPDGPVDLSDIPF